MISASITTTHRGSALPKGGRVYAVVTLATTGLKVRANRAWNQEDSPMDNHRRAILGALDDAGLPRDDYTLDGFRDFWGNGHWVLNRNAQSCDINALVRKAEDQFKDLKAEYRKGEAEDLRQKYLDEIYDAMDKAAYVVTFLRSNV